jgi:hypothetical protein
MSRDFMTCTREEALAAGLLINIDAKGEKLGLPYAVDISSAVEGACINVARPWPWMNTAYRVRDLLEAVRTLLSSDASGVKLRFTFMVRPDGREPFPVELAVLCMGGDLFFERVITILLADEDAACNWNYPENEEISIANNLHLRHHGVRTRKRGKRMATRWLALRSTRLRPSTQRCLQGALP